MNNQKQKWKRWKKLGLSESLGSLLKETGNWEEDREGGERKMRGATATRISTERKRRKMGEYKYRECSHKQQNVLLQYYRSLCPVNASSSANADNPAYVLSLKILAKDSHHVKCIRKGIGSSQYQQLILRIILFQSEYVEIYSVLRSRCLQMAVCIHFS